MKSVLLAPCGINCGVCIAYLRETNKCPGCRLDTIPKPVTRNRCKIKTCPELKKHAGPFCFQCKTFPCKQMKQMDKRYRTRYHMSTIENLETLKALGVRAYLKKEKKRWACPSCGGTRCVHRGYCIDCGKTYPVQL